MFSKFIPGNFSSTVEGPLVPCVEPSTQDCLYVQPFGHLSQIVLAREAKPVRLLCNGHAKNGQPWKFEYEGVLDCSFPYRATYVRFQDRYHEMSRCTRQWRHLKDLKRGAAGHALKAVDDLGDRTLALECPACPHPGRNLPPDWDDATNDRA